MRYTPPPTISLHADSSPGGAVLHRADGPDTQRVAIVNEMFVRKFSMVRMQLAVT